MHLKLLKIKGRLLSFLPLLLIILLLFAQSCARIPDHELAVMADSTQIANPVSEALQSGNFYSGDGPQRCWWTPFEDAVLDSIMETALAQSPTLQIAESKLKAAHQAALQKKAALFPEVDFEADSNWQHLAKWGFFRAFAPTIPPVVNDVNLGLSFTYEFDIWGKYRDIYRAALGEMHAMIAEKAQAELILTSSIAYSYMQLQMLLKKQELLQEKESHRKRIAELRMKRDLHEIDSEIVELFSNIDALETAAFLEKLSLQIELQKHQIKALAGMGQDAPLEIPLNRISPFAVSLPSSLSLDLVARRPDLIAQKARVEALGKLIDAAKTDFYPNISLTAFLGLDSVYWNKLFKRESYRGQLDPAIHLPIFTAGRLRAHLMESVANFNEAVYSYNQTILLAAQEVVDQLSAISSLENEISIRQTELKARTRQEVLFQKRFRHQIDSEIVYLNARNAVLDLEFALADLQYGKQLANILLIRSLGGGV